MAKRVGTKESNMKESNMKEFNFNKFIQTKSTMTEFDPDDPQVFTAKVLAAIDETDLDSKPELVARLREWTKLPIKVKRHE